MVRVQLPSRSSYVNECCDIMDCMCREDKVDLWNSQNADEFFA